MVEQFSIPLSGITVIEPTGFFEFLQLESNARLILTDSGGVQEESCILGVPCVTLRNTTERPETIEVGANVLVGTSPEQIRDGVREMLNQQRHWENPYGDGNTSVRIVNSISGTNGN
jgi:UDP-N-acetylglucosamine 2-epimerase (non-hydrolysing)